LVITSSHTRQVTTIR